MNVNVNGHILRTGLPTSVTTVTTTPYTISGSANKGYIVLLVNCTSSAISINLPTAANNTDYYVIKKIDSSGNGITIDPYSTETIDGSTTASIKVPYTSLNLVSDGSNWHII